MKFNVNDQVKLKLTARGKKIHRDNHNALFASMPASSAEYIYWPPPEDAEGWSTWQMWQAMKEFGPHITMGFDPPFETTIEIVVP